LNYKIITAPDGKDTIVTTHIVHTFRVSDSDDPDIYAAQGFCAWENSDQGQWIMNNAFETPSWHRHLDNNTYGYLYQIRALLTPEQITFFELKYK